VASRSRVAALGKGITIPCALRLAAKRHGDAVTVNITLTEYSSWYRWEGDDLLLSLKVQPNAARDAFIAPFGDRYKIAISAPPTEGKANARLVSFLAKSFGVGRKDVVLVNGGSSRNKGVRITAPRKMPIPTALP